MKLLVYECQKFEADAKREWLIKEIGLPIFKEHSRTGVAFAFITTEIYQFVLIVMNEEEESYLKLKYPPDTFKDFTA